MVRIEEVEDWNDSDSSSTSSSSSSTNSLQLAPFDPSSETLSERLYALRDIIPPSTRAALADTAARTASWVQWGGKKVGGAAWIVTTSALMVGLPLMLSIEGEAGIVAQEKEYLGQQAGGAGAFAPQTGQPGSAPPSALVPPGF